MTQRELNCAVARATGESINRVARVGFNLMPTPKSIPYWRRARRRPLSAPGGRSMANPESLR